MGDNEDVTRAITTDPEIMRGTPVFRGTQVPVQTLFEYLEGGEVVAGFLQGLDQRSLGLRPVCLATRASIFGPISSDGWNASV